MVDAERLTADYSFGSTSRSVASVLEGLDPVARDLYFHLDLDVLDRNESPGNTYSPPGGLPIRCVAEIIDAFARRFALCAAAITAYDPAVDPGDRTARTGLEIARRLAAFMPSEGIANL